MDALIPKPQIGMTCFSFHTLKLYRSLIPNFANTFHGANKFALPTPDPCKF